MTPVSVELGDQCVNEQWLIQQCAELIPETWQLVRLLESVSKLQSLLQAGTSHMKEERLAYNAVLFYENVIRLRSSKVLETQ